MELRNKEISTDLAVSGACKDWYTVDLDLAVPKWWYCCISSSPSSSPSLLYHHYVMSSMWCFYTKATISAGSITSHLGDFSTKLWLIPRFHSIKVHVIEPSRGDFQLTICNFFFRFFIRSIKENARSVQCTMYNVQCTSSTVFHPLHSQQFFKRLIAD